MAMAPLQVMLLGDFRVVKDDAPVTGLHSPRLQALLAYLILHRDAPQFRRHLAFLFWPDSSEKQARTNLRHLLHDLHHVLPCADTLLRTDSQTVQWRPTIPVTLDVADFEAAIAAGTPDDLARAAALYCGELLPGCYDDWIHPERERLHRLYATVLEQLIDHAEQQRRLHTAIAHAERLLQHDSLQETAYRNLMRLHALNGDRAAALHVYHTCVRVLRRELGVPPDAATRALHEQLVMIDAPGTQVAPKTEGTEFPLVGRTAEWAQLVALWRAVSTGRPQMVLIAGDAGIGKTRLAGELIDWVARQSGSAARIALARGYAAGGDLPYAPVAEWLRAQPLPPLDPVWKSEVARLLPEILAGDPQLPPPEPLHQAWQRHRLFEALARALLAGRQARLLVLDDLQWCDRATLEWLHYLLRFDARAPLLVVCTMRSDESQSAELASLLAGLRRDGLIAEIALGPLDAAATTALAEHVAGRSLDAAVTEPLYHGSEGNPLFIVEMVQAGLAPGGSQARKTGPAQQGSPSDATWQPLPAKVRQILERRLAQLSPAARELAELAATMGRRFDLETLRAAAAMPDTALIPCLDELWQRRIVREHGNGHYDFSHVKIRETAYIGLSEARRRLLHRHIAQALEAIHAAALDAVSGQIGWHFEQAGLAASAVAYYCRAAEASQQVYDAKEDAIGYYRRALALLSDGTDNDAAAAARIWVRLGDILHLVAHYAAAREAFQHALDNVDPADRVAQADLHRKLGNSWREERLYPTARQVYDTGLRLLGEPPSYPDGQAAAESDGRRWWQAWIDLRFEIVQTYYWLGESRFAVAQMEEMRGQVDQYATALQRVHFFSQYVTLLWQHARFAPTPQTEVLLREAQRAIAEAVEAQQTPSIVFRLGFLLLWHGMLAEAEKNIRTALAWAERSIDLTLQVRCLVYLGIVYRRQDRPNDVRACAERGLELATAAQMPEYVATVRANLAWLAWRAGDLAAVDRHGRAALALWAEFAPGHPSTPFQWTALLPLLAADLHRGQITQAAASARTLLLPTQQRLPDALTDLLASAVDADDAGNLPAVQQWLQRALDAAIENHHL